MSPSLLSDISIFILSLLVGFEVISKVPATLHTPLMSAANSIHGIVFIGAMLAAATANDALGYVLAFLTATFASANLVGGYAVTDRMLQMFRARPVAPAGQAARTAQAAPPPPGGPAVAAGTVPAPAAATAGAGPLAPDGSGPGPTGGSRS